MLFCSVRCADLKRESCPECDVFNTLMFEGNNFRRICTLLPRGCLTVVVSVRFVNAKGERAYAALFEVYGEGCMAVENIQKSCREFSRCRSERRRRPSDDIMAKIVEVIGRDRRSVFRELALLTADISKILVHKVSTWRSVITHAKTYAWQ